MKSTLIEIELSEQDLARCLDVLRGLTFSQIQALVWNQDEDEAYRSQASLLRLREQLELAEQTEGGWM